MSISTAIKKKDLGIGQLRKDLEQLRSSVIYVGIQGDEAREPHPSSPDETVGRVAAWMHYGTESSPARPFVDVGISNIRQQALDAIRKAASDLVDGRADSVIAALSPVGEVAAKAVVGAVNTASFWAKPLAESTVRSKGHSAPLIDTGTLRESVTYTILYNGGILAKGKPA